MAQPARNFEQEDNESAPFEDTKPDWYKNKKVFVGGGESSEPTGHLKSVPDAEDLASKEEEAKETSGSSGLSDAERSEKQNVEGNSSQTDSFYNEGKSGRSGIRGRFNSMSGRKKAGLGAGAIGGLAVGGGLLWFLIFAPFFRLESYLATINARVFTAASSAVSHRVEGLFENYMAGYVLSLDKCGNTTFNGCRASYANAGFASQLFKNWQDAKIEQKLFNDYHFQLVTNKNATLESGKYILKDPLGNEVTLKKADLEAGHFTGGSRVMGNEMNAFLRDKTQWYQVMQRRSIRKYLVRKHGVKFWCLFACEQKDAIDLKVTDAKTKLKYKMVERLVYPFSPKYAFIMNCLISPQGTNPGEPCSADALSKEALDRGVLTEADITEISTKFAQDKTLTFSSLMTQTLLEKVMAPEAAQRVVSLVPGAGEVYLALSFADMMNQADQCLANYCLSHYAAQITSNQYLEYYTSMRSSNDEMKAGKLSPDEVGALSDQFNEGSKSAESSRVYQAYSNQSNNLASLVGTAYAAPANDNYTCANGDPIPKGELVCPEKKVSRTFAIEDIRNNKVVAGIDGILNTYNACFGVPIDGCIGARPSDFIHPFLEGVNHLSGIVFGPLASGIVFGLEHNPITGGIVSFARSKANDLFQAFFHWLIPLPIQPDSPGRDRYDGLQAGGEVAASEFGKGGYTDSGQPYGLGGQLLTTDQQVAIADDYNQQQNYNYSHSSLIAKLTNLDNQGSLANMFINAAPKSLSQVPQQFAVFLTNPFKGFGSLMFHHVSAANNTAAINAFGIPRYGYPVNDPAFNADPSIYTDQYCQQMKDKWQQSKAYDQVTGDDQYTTTNPCLLEQVSIEAASSLFTGDDSLNN